MKKKTIILLILLFPSLLLIAQQDFTSPDVLIDKISSTNKNGMLVLGSWGAANLLAGGILSLTNSGQHKYFWQMNAAWNTVNLGIATFGYFGAAADYASASEMLNGFENYKRAYLFNAGLDAAYIMTGFYLKELAKRKPAHEARLSGYGNSIILQGAFLMAFDFIMYFINQNSYNLHISPWIDELHSTAGLSLTVAF